MRRIDCGVSWGTSQGSEIGWTELGLGQPWNDVIEMLAPGTRPRPLQIAALGQHRVLETRRNIVISAPTNSGKSLVSTLLMIDAVRRGRRALLLEPLRAIAGEKVEELSCHAKQLSHIIGRHVAVHISTGDYRLEDETFDSRPQGGEVVIATPERFDAILRNPENDDWVESIDTVCVDEGHLLGSANRGPTLEYVVTYLRSMPTPPRIVLLSATLGNADELAAWLSPCDVVLIKDRYPRLHKEIIQPEGSDDLREIICSEVGLTLAQPDASVLIFVYQTRSAEKLASELNEVLGATLGLDGALAYHSRMSAARRKSVREAVMTGRCRCVISTTALGLGVNLPVDRVIIRDIVFPGVGKLETSELVQMMGRAGRGDREGWASVIARTDGTWDTEELCQCLRDESVVAVRSRFAQVSDRFPSSRSTIASGMPPLTPLVASQLARRPDDGFSQDQIEKFFLNSFGGRELTERVPESLAWLNNNSRVLAFKDEKGSYCLTVLGYNATRTVLPLTVATGFGQLIRDLLTIDDDKVVLNQWSAMDHLLVLDLLSERSSGPRLAGKQSFEMVDSWMESHPKYVPLLYKKWIKGNAGASRAREVLGSLGVDTPKGQKNPDEWARKTAYAALARSIILYERGQGTNADDVERRWRITDLEGVEERWRDEMLWLLNGLARLCELRCFYYHLIEECSATIDQVRQVSSQLKRMRSQVFDLLEHTKYCSALGPALRSIRRTRNSAKGSTVGLQTIRRLEESGITSLGQLSQMNLDDLVALGIRRTLAVQILSYLKRRMQ